jgi:hypothetical protein
LFQQGQLISLARLLGLLSTEECPMCAIDGVAATVPLPTHRADGRIASLCGGNLKTHAKDKIDFIWHFQ